MTSMVRKSDNIVAPSFLRPDYQAPQSRFKKKELNLFDTSYFSGFVIGGGTATNKSVAIPKKKYN